jgi:hypothetical protein
MGRRDNTEVVASMWELPDSSRIKLWKGRWSSKSNPVLEDTSQWHCNKKILLTEKLADVINYAR